VDSQLRSRAAVLKLTDDDVERWEEVVDDAFVSALLGSLLAFEDAVNELTP